MELIIIRDGEDVQVEALAREFGLFQKYCSGHWTQCNKQTRHALLVEHKEQFLVLMGQTFPYGEENHVNIEIMVVGDLPSLSMFLEFAQRFSKATPSRSYAYLLMGTRGREMVNDLWAAVFASKIPPSTYIIISISTTMVRPTGPW